MNAHDTDGTIALNERIAATLSRAMQERGIGNKQLAERMGVHVNTVNSWRSFHDMRMPSIYRLKRLCEVLDVSADVFLGLEERE